jgi:hypothetical protein
VQESSESHAPLVWREVIISLVSCSDRVRSVPVSEGCEKLIINVGNDTCYSLNSTTSNGHKM